MKIHDQHVHSCYSLDSEQSIKEYLNKATDLGLKYFILTDHYDLDFLGQGNKWCFDINKQHQEVTYSHHL